MDEKPGTDDLNAAALDAEPALDRERGLRKSAEAENARLRKLVTQQDQAIQSLRTERIPLTPKSLPEPTEAFIRVVIPDTHGSIINEGAAKAFLADFKALNPAEIIMLGDHIDCGGFLAEHHTLGYVAETTYSFSDDAEAANRFLDAVQENAPNASIHYLSGNHEERIERWCIDTVMKTGKGTRKDVEMLLSCFAVEHVLSLKERGISHYKTSQHYEGCEIPGTIRRGQCFFTHGTRIVKSAAKETLADFGSNVVFGHTHRIQSYQSSTVKEGGICAWNIGCLCEKQPLWANRRLTGWAHGYGVQFVQGNGDFLHQTVPIINGRSFLVPLTRLVS